MWQWLPSWAAQPRLLPLVPTASGKTHIPGWPLLCKVSGPPLEGESGLSPLCIRWTNICVQVRRLCSSIKGSVWLGKESLGSPSTINNINSGDFYFRRYFLPPWSSIYCRHFLFGHGSTLSHTCVHTCTPFLPVCSGNLHIRTVQIRTVWKHSPWSHMATEHMKCGSSEPKCAVNVKATLDF